MALESWRSIANGKSGSGKFGSAVAEGEPSPHDEFFFPIG